ncbi:DNA repair protein RadA [Halanaerobacter jeridensis]|uniref:DNA repair protein RadA n=1 Tax=Halanaerobacter jeridensis TaxID=706427 RepID=A0A938XQA6_9FIRM|nr:DNA repair protein RadA [Halanaerobacter jeridensis]MBM7557863.1 DNA repair protein RadA/Sms [Halanaerobacter jeridensis]
MAKKRKRYVCSECGYEALKWNGQCPECKSWNTLEETIFDPDKAKEEEQKKLEREQATSTFDSEAEVRKISDIKVTSEDRLKTGFSELNRVLGGGVVPGSLTLIGGAPGVGKSTLLLQTANNVAENYDQVLYVSGEESERQIKIRADRLNSTASNLYILADTNLNSIITQIKKLQPDLIIIDSIQTIYNPTVDSAPGSIKQVRETTSKLMEVGKRKELPLFIVGHVTKEGSIAGPKVLEHMVDTVLYFEGDQNHSYRMLKGIKNRFGSTNEVGIFEMNQGGLEEVLNPSQTFIAERPEEVSGSVIVPCVEGSRSILAELQALVSSANFGNPSRMTTGVDRRRVSLILAVLEKRLGLNIQMEDIHINVAGGFEIKEPAIDLGLATAMVSSFRDKPIPSDFAIIGEIGLSGEVRAVNKIQKRVNEASKLGFNKFILPQGNLDDLSQNDKLSFFGVKKISKVLDLILGGE